MKRSDYHMLVMFILISPHINPWVALALGLLNVCMAFLWATKE